MIQVTAYLRDEEDLRRWRAVKNKTALIHDTLQGVPYEVEGTKEELVSSVKVQHETGTVSKRLKANGFCPNGHSIPEGRNKCLGRGCKYS